MSNAFGDAADSQLAEARAVMLREHLAARGVNDPRVLAAMAQVPREAFVPAELRAQAYADHPLRIGFEQTISQPYMVARMTQLLNLQSGQSVLEIGTGSGYQAAVLAALGARVFSVERLPALSQAARARLTRLGIASVRLRDADGSDGWPEFAPYDRVLVTCAAPVVPRALLAQLADGGRLVAPVGDLDSQRLVLIDRRGAQFQTGEADACRFVPLVGAAGFEPEAEPARAGGNGLDGSGSDSDSNQARDVHRA